MKKISEILGRKEIKNKIFHPSATEIVEEPLAEMAWGARRNRGCTNDEYKIEYLEDETSMADYLDLEY